MDLKLATLFVLVGTVNASGVINPSFETEVVADGASTSLHTGWYVEESGSKDLKTFNPTSAQFPGIVSPASSRRISGAR